MIALFKIPLLKILIPVLGLFWILAVLVVYLWSKEQIRLRILSSRPVSRPPGAAVDALLSKRYRDLALWALTIGFVPTYVTLSYFRGQAALASSVVAGVGALVTVLAVIKGRECMRAVRCLHVTRAGKLLVGRLLEEVLSREFRVFHDVCVAGQTIDHVVIGPTGIFAVSSVTRVPAEGSVQDPVVSVDGGRLRFSDAEQEEHRTEVSQARRDARWLEEWLEAATFGRCSWVRPVLVLPGWQIRIEREPAALVLNESSLETLSQGRRVVQPTAVHDIAGRLRACSRAEYDRPGDSRDVRGYVMKEQQ